MKTLRYAVGTVIVVSLILVAFLFMQFGWDPIERAPTKTGFDFIKEMYKTILSVCVVGGMYFLYQGWVTDREKKAEDKEKADNIKRENEKAAEEKQRKTEELAREQRQKQRDFDGQLRRDFINNYGRFKANVRTWGVYKNVPNVMDELMSTAIEAEGWLEALIVEASSRRALSDKEACLIGLYRQGYQTLRQRLQKNTEPKPPHNYSKHDYHLFAMLFAALADILTAERKSEEQIDIQSNLDRIYECRSDSWELAIRTYSKDSNVNDTLKACAKKHAKDRILASS